MTILLLIRCIDL